MKITQEGRKGWEVLTDTSNLRFKKWDAEGAVFECYGIARNGDRIEYQVRLSGTELRNIKNAPARDTNVISMLEYLEGK